MKLLCTINVINSRFLSVNSLILHAHKANFLRLGKVCIIFSIPLELQETIKKLMERIEHLERQNHFARIHLQSLEAIHCGYSNTELLTQSVSWEHGMRPPVNYSMPPFSPPINCVTPPGNSVSSPSNSITPSGMLNMSLDSPSLPASSQWSGVNTSRATTTVTPIKCVATTQVTTGLVTGARNAITTTPNPPVKTIAKVLVSTVANTESSMVKTDNADVPLTITTKENIPLPPINHDKLFSPQTVADKYPKLLVRSKIPTLAVKLAKEAFFGPEIMSYCTFKGVGSYHALSQAEVKEMKQFLFKLTFPSIVSSRIDFEDVWAKCVESVGQKCKMLRHRRLENLELK